MHSPKIAFLVLLGAAWSAGLAGCMAPVRARKEKAEAAFDRLAQLPPEKLAAALDRRMTAELQLTPQQQSAVAAINLKYARELHNVAAGGDRLRDKARTLREQADAKAAELRSVLTPEQFSRFEEMKEQLREMMEQAR